MADELERVRISAAELRAEASNFTSHDDHLKELQKEGKKQHQRDCKRPDLQRYKPGGAQSHRHKDSVRDAHIAFSDSMHPQGDCSSENDMKRPDNSPTSPGCSHNLGIDSENFPNDSQHETKDYNPKELVDGNAVKSSDSASASTSRSPKQSRKMRKPDREIYQPGGRRSQGNRETGTNKVLDGVTKEEKRKEEAVGGKSVEKDASKNLPLEEVKEKEEKWRNRREKDNRKKQDQGKKSKGSVDSPSASISESNVESITGNINNLSISGQVVEESEKNREEGGQDGPHRRKPSREGRRVQAGMGEDQKKEKGNGKLRAGKEKGSNYVFPKKEEGEVGGRGSETAQYEQEKGKRPEGRRQRNVGAKEGSHDQNLNHEKQRGNRLKFKGAERGKKSEGTDLNTVYSAPKRYSQSDVRRPRNRTYSTSSASSGTSMDGLAEAERRRSEGAKMESAVRTTERTSGQREFVRGSQARQRRRTALTLSSTDSLEENEAWEREDRRDLRDRDAEDTRSSHRGLEGGGRGQRASCGRGGILRVSLQKYSSTSLGAREEQASRKKQNPGGHGRGILVLPAHTDLTMAPEPGPQLGGMRGGMGLSRGRGGRGGGTRRLWDPNNPDKKPALVSSKPSQNASLQQALYFQQGGCGPLHFLDTDDETAGSPPVRQGEYLQNQQAAAMGYYKFQNSDNPYGYPITADSLNTPPRYPYPYHIPYQIPVSNGMYPASAILSFYGPYGQGGQAYPPSGGSSLTPEEAEVQTRGELGKLLRLADSQELQLSNLLSRDRLSLEGLERMAQLRAELLTIYERVILTDIEFSDSQNLDQALWKNVFYQVIESFRQLLKDQTSDTSPNIKTMLMSILEEGTVFFDSLLQKLQTVFQFKLEDYMDCMAVRARPLRKTVKYALISAQRSMICQGDIARYREQASDSANYGKARSWYLKAQQIAPKNGRPYNQLALLAVYTKRKLDAVYYYMRSLAASNPILTAKESLMSLFEEAKRKADQIEHRLKQDTDGGTRSLRSHASGGRRVRGEDTRVEIWICSSGHPGTSRTTGSESGKDSEQDAELGNLSASDLNKRFILSFLHSHGKLFTKVGMESFPAVASKVLHEFRALLQHSPSPLGSTRMLQIITINMFAIHNAQIRAEGQGESRSVLEEQTTSLGLAMFGLLVQRCTELLKETPAEPIPAEELGEFDEMDYEEGMVRVSAFAPDLRELLPSIKVWSDWMLGHPEQWNPPPHSMQGSPDVWQCLAELCNSLSHVYHSESLLYKADVDGEGDEELRVLQLDEDKMLAGFVPLLAAPQDPCYIDKGADTAIAADCKRVTVLKYFLEALCGQEEPLLAFKGGKYVSMATPPTPSISAEDKTQTQEQEDDVIVEESSLSASEGDGSEDDIKELRARRHALTHKLAQQQKRRDKIQAVLQTGGQLEIEIRPFYLVPDTNGFIDYLDGLRKLLACGTYVLVVPLIVITELDGLAKGQDSREGIGNGAHARQVQERAKASVMFLEKAFESRDPYIRALTSRGNTLESIALRSEDTSGQKGNNDDVILSCCLHYCQDKAKDFMPAERNGPVRLHREVVLLTDDRNLRVKALTRNVPVRDIPAFLSWSKVG
ncbi:telomerase-binding protein EST1A-like isoform X1 [Xyrauchen texanus]|uniref:telomerase-binding protein EST1A-like isoform X1 n=2 Tax=Xyrauchen texanus TaxID=154827 RepID=UPI0022418863|nr:telomerase-binding protein EST1A-like isoform X1 [Xyrauchen texanus]